MRTIYDSDKIIVLQGGRVAESGTHAQLINQAGVYSELWNGEFVFPVFHGLLIFDIAQETSPDGVEDADEEVGVANKVS